MDKLFSSNNINFYLIKYDREWPLYSQEWLSLYNSSLDACIFYHPLFIDTANVLGPEAPSHIILGYENNQLIFGLPIQQQQYGRLFYDITMFNAKGFDHLEPLDSSENLTATNIFLQYLCKRKLLLIFKGSNVSRQFYEIVANNCCKNNIPLFARVIFRCPYLLLPKNKKDILKLLSNNFKSNIKKAENKAISNGIFFRFLNRSTSSLDILDTFQNLRSLHASRFDSISKSSKFLNPTTQKYFNTICEKASLYNDILWFTEAVIDNQVIGSLMGFLSRNKFYYFQSGFSPKYASFSLGNLLLYHTMISLIDQGIYYFDFLRGMDTYKLKWTKTSEVNYLVFFSNSFPGRIILQWHRLRRAIKRYGRLKGLKCRLAGND